MSNLQNYFSGQEAQHESCLGASPSARCKELPLKTTEKISRGQFRRVLDLCEPPSACTPRSCRRAEEQTRCSSYQEMTDSIRDVYSRTAAPFLYGARGSRRRSCPSARRTRREGLRKTTAAPHRPPSGSWREGLAGGPLAPRWTASW
jgi:hypothetical protein